MKIVWPMLMAGKNQRIESFTRHVRDQAKALLGADLARVEKFTTSVKDGIDLRRKFASLARPSLSVVAQKAVRFSGAASADRTDQAGDLCQRNSTGAGASRSGCLLVRHTG